MCNQSSGIGKPSAGSAVTLYSRYISNLGRVLQHVPFHLRFESGSLNSFLSVFYGSLLSIDFEMLSPSPFSSSSYSCLLSNLKGSVSSCMPCHTLHRLHVVKIATNSLHNVRNISQCRKSFVEICMIYVATTSNINVI